MPTEPYMLNLSGFSRCSGPGRSTRADTAWVKERCNWHDNLEGEAKRISHTHIMFRLYSCKRNSSVNVINNLFWNRYNLSLIINPFSNKLKPDDVITIHKLAIMIHSNLSPLALHHINSFPLFTEYKFIPSCKVERNQLSRRFHFIKLGHRI